MLSAVIYDLDDLLVNSYAIHVEATRVLLQRYGLSYPKLPAQQQRRFVGMRVRDVLQELYILLAPPLSFPSFVAEREKIFLQLVQKRLQLLPGAFSSLKKFKKAGWKIALGSSGTKKYITIVLDKFSLHSFFDVIVSGDDVKQGKPNPEVYRLAAQRLRKKPSQCLVLEDATNGIRAAKAAGCYCIAVQNPYTPKQDLAKADAVVKSLNDLKV